MARASKSAANETRGEATLKLEGVPYVMRPSFEAIDAFERQTGKGLLKLAQEAMQGDLSSRDTAIIATECFRAHGRATSDTDMARFSVDRVHALLLEMDGGMVEALGLLGVMLSMAATGGYTASGEVKAATGTTQATPAAA